MNTTAQERYKTNRPIRIDSLYCYGRKDVITIIHNEIKSDQCDSVELMYESTEGLYGKTVNARDSALAIQKRIITGKDFIISKKDEQIKIEQDKYKIAKKEIWKTKVKAWVIPTGVAVIVISVGVGLAKVFLF